MASSLSIVWVAIVAIGLWTMIGLAFARRVLPPALALPAAPVLGWAVHSALALPVHRLVGTSRIVVVLQIAASVAAALALHLRRPHARISPSSATPLVPAWAYAAAFLIALAPAIAVFPKPFADGVALASPIFDHSKVAMIDEIIRSGVRPANPFFGTASERLSYYFLWHFSAAELAIVTGFSSWEADAGLAWFTAFASLSLMMGVTVSASGRASAAVFVLLLALTASARPVISAIVGAPTHEWLLQEASGFGGWLFQSSWAPQHLISASCTIVSMLVMARTNLKSTPHILVLSLLAAAAFSSSVWIGGITFALAATALCVALIPRMTASSRRDFVIGVALAALLASILSSSFLYDQYTAASQRDGGSPFALRPYRVFGDTVPLRLLFDVPAYWLVHLVVELPAVYPAAIIAIALVLCGRLLINMQPPITTALLTLAATGLLIAAFAVSTVGVNNDLAWRAALPAIMILMIFAATGLSASIASTRSRWLAVAALGVIIGLPEGTIIIHQNAFPRPTESAASFAQTPAMWAAVRRHSSALERIGNNPYYQRDLTPWPINLSWALLSNRRSCFAGLEFIIPFTPLKREERDAIDAQFRRVFGGQANAGDVEVLGSRYDCRVIIVTSEDGAWANDPFAASPQYRLVEQDATRWRIYRFDEREKS